jgi:hypothetical protein
MHGANSRLTNGDEEANQKIENAAEHISSWG